jgi:hypothetical protein
VAQKRRDFDEAEKFPATVFVPDNAAKPRDITGLVIRCLPAIAFGTRDGLHLSRKSGCESVVTESNKALRQLASNCAAKFRSIAAKLL